MSEPQPVDLLCVHQGADGGCNWIRWECGLCLWSMQISSLWYSVVVNNGLIYNGLWTGSLTFINTNPSEGGERGRKAALREQFRGGVWGWKQRDGNVMSHILKCLWMWGGPRSVMNGSQTGSCVCTQSLVLIQCSEWMNSAVMSFRLRRLLMNSHSSGNSLSWRQSTIIRSSDKHMPSVVIN